MITNFLFYFFSFSLILSSLMVISVQNAVHSVLFLVLSFISSASLLFLLECEFIALLFIMIYVGAIAVLFLFVVMMLDTKIVNIKKDLVKYFPFGSLIGILFSFEIFLLISKNFTSNSYINSVLYNFHTNWFDKLDTLTELESIGQILYTNYVLQFLIAGNILLLSAIGAVSLTLKTKQSPRKQIIFKQLSRTYKNVLVV